MVDIEPQLMREEELDLALMGYVLCSFGSLNNTESAENKVVGILLRHIRFLQEEIYNG